MIILLQFCNEITFIRWQNIVVHIYIIRRQPEDFLFSSRWRAAKSDPAPTIHKIPFWDFLDGMKPKPTQPNPSRMVTSVDLGDLSKDIKFICNTFIYDLIVEFYRATKNKSSLVAIPSIGSLQHCFPQFTTWSNREVGRKENETTCLVYCNTFINLHHHCLGEDLNV